MKSEEKSQAYLRKRKMLLVMPVLVIPFLTLAFWSNGGGKVYGKSSMRDNSTGLNLNLPDAKLKDNEPGDKLSFYDKADKDSIKMAELMGKDPYYKGKDTSRLPSNELERITQATANKYNQPLNTSPYEVAPKNTEQKIMDRLASLEREMNRPEVTPTASGLPGSDSEPQNKPESGDMDRLENMLQMINQKPATDPEMSQIDNTLEKILDIQHPDRMREKIKGLSAEKKDKVFPVSQVPPDVPISFFGNSKIDTVKPKSQQSSGFYGLSNNDEAVNEANAIEAVVHESQIVTNGSIVKLRLLTDIYINGTLIPKDNFVFGQAVLSGERLEVELNSIRYHNSLFPVSLSVYDLDGLKGIYIPGAITRDVAKQSADNSLQLMELSTVSPNIGVQAAGAGINAMKSLLSRKVKLVKVTVKTGYKVLLREDKVK